MGDILGIYPLQRFTTGRRIWAQRRVEEQARAQGLEELAAHAEQAVVWDRGTRSLEQRWRRQQHPSAPATPTTPERPAPPDGPLDDMVVALHLALGALVRGSRQRPERLKQTTALLGELFPQGVKPITQAPWIEEHSAVELLLERMAEHQDAVTALGLLDYQEQLQALNAAFGSFLKRPGAAPIGFKEVRAARDAGQRRLIETTSGILWLARGDAAAPTATRAALLAPILEQHEALRALRSRHQPVSDVDPDTGLIEADPEPAEPDEDAPQTPAGGAPTPPQG